MAMLRTMVNGTARRMLGNLIKTSPVATATSGHMLRTNCDLGTGGCPDLNRKLTAHDLTIEEVIKLTDEYFRTLTPNLNYLHLFDDEVSSFCKVNTSKGCTGQPLTTLEEVYIVIAGKQELNDDRNSLFKDLMQKADYASGFICCSEYEPHCFFAKLDKKQAANLKGVREITAVYPVREHSQTLL